MSTPKTTRDRKRRDPVAPLQPAAETAAAPTGRAFRRAQDVAPEPEAPAPRQAPGVDADALQELVGLDEADFGRMMAEAMEISTTRFQPGQAVRGRVVGVGDRDVFIDLGGKSEGSIALEELLDPRGRPVVSVGDHLEAFVASARDGEVRLTLRLSGAAGRSRLEQAAASGELVDGKVLERNAGGFVVDVGGVRTFCPLSQIARPPVADPDVFVGQVLRFAVRPGDGDEFVVSHRKVQEQEVAEAASRLRSELGPGQERTGTIRSVRPFGLFVDLGGVEGLLHVSRLGSGDDVLEPYSEGQAIRVRVLDWDAEARRLSLALADAPRRPAASTSGGQRASGGLGTFADLFAKAGRR